MAKRRYKPTKNLEPYRVPDESQYCITLASRTKGWTAEGKAYLTKADDFCACLRTIVDRELRQVPYKKQELSLKYNLSSRLYNSCEVFAKGEKESIVATAQLSLETALAKLASANRRHKHAYMAGNETKLDGEARRTKKWKRRLREARKRVEHPSYFPGREVFNQQAKLGSSFAKEFEYARANRIVSVGTWEETTGNSELQVHFVELVSFTYKFKLIHSGNTLCEFKLPRKEGEQLLQRVELNNTPHTFCPKDRLPTKSEFEKKKFDPAFIGPIRVQYQQKQRQDCHLPLTVALLRDHKNHKRWQIRISWMQQGIKPYEVGNTYLSFDTNNDSLAYTLFRLDENGITVLHKAEPHFEAKASNAKDRQRRIHRELNKMMGLARQHNACVVGEDLQWEGAKIGFSAINKMLHCIPYATIRGMIIRKSLKLGIPVRFVNPAYTSILGGLFTHMNRDKAAALVIGLKGSHQGIEFLECVCSKLLQTHSFHYKVEAKHRFSEIVKINDHQQAVGVEHTTVGDKSSIDSTRELSRILSDVAKHRRQLHYRNKSGKTLPSRVSLESIRHTAVPGSPTGEPKPKHCSSLSKLK